LRNISADTEYINESGEKAAAAYKPRYFEINSCAINDSPHSLEKIYI